MDGGLYTQVNNSPRPEGSANSTPSITKGREGKRVGSREGKETTNIYLLSLLSLFFHHFIVIYDWWQRVLPAQVKSLFFWRQRWKFFNFYDHSTQKRPLYLKCVTLSSMKTAEWSDLIQEVSSSVLVLTLILFILSDLGANSAAHFWKVTFKMCIKHKVWTAGPTVWTLATVWVNISSLFLPWVRKYDNTVGCASSGWGGFITRTS